MRILVTGGAGFIGFHLTERLLADGHEVTVWDIFHTGQKKNRDHFSGNSKYRFQEQDVRSAADFAGDAVINLACPASPVHYQHDPVFTWETSVLGAHHLLELCRKKKMMFMHASTSEVYGDPHVHPQPEGYWGNVNTVGIRSCYDEGKRAVETIAMDYKRARGVDTRLFRIFNTYGPRMLADDGRVVSNFCVQALKNTPMTIYGDGSQTRSFCYVSDLVDGIVRYLNLPGEKVDGPVNLGNEGEFTIKELAGLIEEALGRKLQITYKDLPSDDPKQRKPVIEKARTLLGWEPRIPLRDGIRKTLEYFAEETGVKL